MEHKASVCNLNNCTTKKTSDVALKKMCWNCQIEASNGIIVSFLCIMPLIYILLKHVFKCKPLAIFSIDFGFVLHVTFRPDCKKIVLLWKHIFA